MLVQKRHNTDAALRLLTKLLKTQESAQRFLATDAAVYNTLNVQRHLISRSTLRLFRAEAYAAWATATAPA
jgi:transposase-like protein